MKGIYGVNVAKVREVVRMPRINPLASRIPGIAGIFELRGVPIPAIHLNHVLGDQMATIGAEQQIVVTEFSQKRAGFIVDQTHRIRRVEWSKVLPPSADAGSCMSGMILIEGNEFLFILDLEKILHNIEAEDGRGRPSAPNFSVYNYHQESAGETESHGDQPVRKGKDPAPVKDLNAPGILVVDDSALVRNNLRNVLTREGFRVIEAENGSLALKRLEEIARGVNRKFGAINAVVTDVEMPLMDGLTLTTKIRENPNFMPLPVILHTSLSGDATAVAARTVGANAYVVKNDVRTLIETLREVLAEVPFALGA